MKKTESYNQLLKHCLINSYQKILVTGSQRSGTTIATEILAHDLQLPAVREEEVGKDDRNKFQQYIENNSRFVLQCPALTETMHLPFVINNVDAIFHMSRDFAHIKRSAYRIDWHNKWDRSEKRKVMETVRKLPSIDQYLIVTKLMNVAGKDLHLDSAIDAIIADSHVNSWHVKMIFWLWQMAEINDQAFCFTLPYNYLENHPKYIQQHERKNFGPRQTSKLH